MWVISIGKNEYLVGYYYNSLYENETHFECIETFEKTEEGKRFALNMCHYLNGGNL